MSISGESNLDDRESTDHLMVTLPCSTADFGEFISNLLGKPQTIERCFSGQFDFYKSHAQNLYQLLDQRIHQQNDASLTQFTAKIIFHDESSILLNSFDDFDHYHEIHPKISISITMSWVYLVKFQRKKVPEKQQIDITVAAGKNWGRESYIYPPPSVFVRISHTERTWGVDIESLLTGHILNWVKTPTRLASFMFDHSAKLAFGIASFFFLISIIGVYFGSNQLVSEQLAAAHTLASAASATSAQVVERIDLLISMVSSGVWSRFTLSAAGFLIIMLVISIILGAWIEDKIKPRLKSFVVLTDAAIKFREEEIQRQKKSAMVLLVSALGSIALNILSNIIYLKYFNSFS